MADEQRNIYEGMFLFPQSAGGGLQGALDHLNEIFTRAEAEVVSLGKWDERRLAYEIKGNKRGVYFLAYLRIAPTGITSLERDCNLSEQILRAMITRADIIPPELIEAAEGREKLAAEIKLRATEAEGEAKPKVVTGVAPSKELSTAPAAAPADTPAAAPPATTAAES